MGYPRKSQTVTATPAKPGELSILLVRQSRRQHLSSFLKRLRIDQRDGPPLELILVADGEVARAVEVFGRAVNFECDFGKGVLKAAFDEANRQVRYVDSNPFRSSFCAA